VTRGGNRSRSFSTAWLYSSVRVAGSATPCATTEQIMDKKSGLAASGRICGVRLS